MHLQFLIAFTSCALKDVVLALLKVVFSRSMRDSGKVKMRVSDPSSLSISLRFLVSVLFIAPIMVAVVVYVVRKIAAASVDADSVLVDDAQLIVAL